MTNEREKRNRYYKYIVKRHLNDIREHIGLSTNEMERSYYNTRYAAQLSILCRSTRHTREVFRTIHSKANDMSTRMTINGVSTCQTAGTEKYESFQLGYGRKRRTLVQYDYRHHTDGELFSCVKPTLEECRNERDKWLNKKQGKEDKL